MASSDRYECQHCQELFKTVRKYDFTPTFSIDDNTNIEVVEEFCVLGVHFLTSMSRQANTDNMDVTKIQKNGGKPHRHLLSLTVDATHTAIHPPSHQGK